MAIIWPPGFPPGAARGDLKWIWKIVENAKNKKKDLHTNTVEYVVVYIMK